MIVLYVRLWACYLLGELLMAIIYIFIEYQHIYIYIHMPMYHYKHYLEPKKYYEKNTHYKCIHIYPL